jgi:RimJ/RimL family protein N-acetyltransferase
MHLVETERLTLRNSDLTDAAFYYGLLNQPSWLQNIGDPKVRNPGDARQYIEQKILASYQKFGFGMYLVGLKHTGEPIGLCGLVKRETLPVPDVGFALLPAYWSHGYAFEAAAAVMRYARDALGHSRLLAIVKPDNARSIRLVERLGFQYEGIHRHATNAEELRLYASEA